MIYLYFNYIGNHSHPIFIKLLLNNLHREDYIVNRIHIRIRILFLCQYVITDSFRP